MGLGMMCWEGINDRGLFRQMGDVNRQLSGYGSTLAKHRTRTNEYEQQQRMRNTDSPSPSCLSDFQPLQKIGEGSYSSVYKVLKRSDQLIYALKKVKMGILSERERNNALNQIRLLASIHSPFIVGYKQAFFEKEPNLLCIVMEWANEGDLQKIIAEQQKRGGLFEESFIWRTTIHILQGLYLLHSKDVLHRDLKTANIFVSDGQSKIGDMNVSKVQTSQALAYTQAGTPYYASPEVWQDCPYDARSDIWSFGCIIYEMCTLHAPFQGNDLQILYKSIMKGHYPPIAAHYSKQLSQLIALCLRKNPKERPSAKELLFNPRGLISKKSKEHGINLHQNVNSFTLHKTILFSSSFTNTQLPVSRYECAAKPKIAPLLTLEKSHSDRNSNLRRKYECSLSVQGSDTHENSESKLLKNRKYHLKLSKKIHNFLGLSPDKQGYRSQKRSPPTPVLLPLKEIEVCSSSNLNSNNYSERQMMPLIGQKRKLTTDRNRTCVDEAAEPRELEIIKQLRRKMGKRQGRQNEQGVAQVIQPRKYTYLVDQQRKEGKNNVVSQQKLSLPLREREQKAYVHHLRKMSKQSGGKKVGSIALLNHVRKYIRIEEVPKMRGLATEEQEPTKMQHVRKKPKKFNKLKQND